jgi:hypothetical protein
MDFFSAAFFTVLIESAVVIMLLKKENFFLALRVVIYANILSLPLVWFFFPSFSWSYVLQIFSSEFFALFSEAFVYAIFLKKSLTNGFLISLAANATSFALFWLTLY